MRLGQKRHSEQMGSNCYLVAIVVTVEVAKGFVPIALVAATIQLAVETKK